MRRARDASRAANLRSRQPCGESALSYRAATIRYTGLVDSSSIARVLRGQSAASSGAGEAGVKASAESSANAAPEGLAVESETLPVTCQQQGRPPLHTLLPRSLLQWRARMQTLCQRPAALAAGTALAVVLMVGVVTALVVVGIAGIGAGNAHFYYPGTSASSFEPASAQHIFPTHLPQVGPPAPEVPDAAGLQGSLAPLPDVSFESLQHAVLQPIDLDSSFTIVEQVPTGNDPASGLLASFDASYERGDIATAAQTTAFPGLKAVFSQVLFYRTAAIASTQLNLVDIQQLGAQAGLPGMAAEPVDLPTVGDESRAVRLMGIAAGEPVEVVIVQFRVNNVIGVLGVAARTGDDPDLLDQAVALARAQMRDVLSLFVP
jgi:hypothetical protein